jgi:group I intron endonuclease
MILYVAINTKTSKRYIGMTTMSLEQRWYHHLWRCDRGVKTALYAAIRKHGREGFVVEPVLSLIPGRTIDDLFDLEQELIAQERTVCPRGYNMTAGGEGTIGYRYTEEQRAKKIGRPCSAETRAKMSAAHIGRPRSTDATAKAIATRRARGGYRKPNLGNLGKVRTPEVKAKLSAAWTPERRQRQAEIMSHRRRTGVCVPTNRKTA